MTTAQPAFATPIEDTGTVLIGPYRSPRNMLTEQTYGGHASIHNDETAQKLGFKGGTIEGPTHFSQFAPLGFALWGERWFSEGCLSVSYRAACYEGENVRAFMAKPEGGATQVEIRLERADGTEILRGTASIGADNPPSALERKLAELSPPGKRVILRDVAPGMRRPRLKVRMGADNQMGKLYPFSLNEKLAVITEPSPWYGSAASDTPWGRAVIPVEMVSVLLNHVAADDPWTIYGPTVDLFTDQEIRMIAGPLFVGDEYEIEREVVALSGSRRTESIWIRTSVYRPGESMVLATMLLSTASLKDSYANYEKELESLIE